MNRIIYALGQKREWRIETGYMFHSMWNAADETPGRIRINHTWRVTLTADVPLKKKQERSTAILSMLTKTK
ncbi:MAG TPA: hypothetical protein VFI06_05005 [Chitinophagaceae bacterium]|nr:hypothetical protein [Chitinophagaceae bacterium]